MQCNDPRVVLPKRSSKTINMRPAPLISFSPGGSAWPGPARRPRREAAAGGALPRPRRCPGPPTAQPARRPGIRSSVSRGSEGGGKTQRERGARSFSSTTTVVVAGSDIVRHEGRRKDNTKTRSPITWGTRRVPSAWDASWNERDDGRQSSHQPQPQQAAFADAPRTRRTIKAHRFMCYTSHHYIYPAKRKEKTKHSAHNTPPAPAPNPFPHAQHNTTTDL